MIRINRGRWLSLTIILLAVITLMLVTGRADAENGNVVARVNDKTITSDQFERQFGITQQQARRQGVILDEQGLVQLKEDVLENLIDNEVLYQETQIKGYKVESTNVDERFSEVESQFSNDQEFETALENMYYTADSFRQAIERRIAIEKYIEREVVPDITVSEDESRQYYDSHQDQFVQPMQVRARHILIVVEDQTNEEKKREALQRIQEVQQKLKDGADFESLAREYSEGPSSSQGGDLGYFQRGQMVKPFEDAAFALQTGELSDVVETRYGYHLIMVTDVRTETVVPFEYANDSIQQYLTQNKTAEKLELLVAALKEGASIKRFPDKL
jgi:peptidyl-prolyl cis-trans isomerase C